VHQDCITLRIRTELLPWVIRSKEDTEHLGTADEHEERKDCEHLKEEADTTNERHYVTWMEIVQQILCLDNKTKLMLYSLIIS